MTPMTSLEIRGAHRRPGPGKRYPIRAAFLALTALFALAGCTTRGGPIPYNVENFGPPDKRMPEDSAYDLPLGPLDVLKINVFQVPDLSGEFQVDSRGFVDLPLIGLTSVRDKRPDEFANSLERLYAAKYLNDPSITVRLMTSSNNNVTVEGGVNRPGVFTLPGKTTLLGTIAMAGGVSTNDGNPKRVAIFRKRGGQTVAAAFDLVALRRGQGEVPLVYPGDTVVVDSSGLRSLYRDLIQSLPLISVFRGL